MENETLIEVKDLSFNYGHGAVLTKLSFALQRGDFAALIGGNGSGKSTLIKLLLGRLSALSGSISLFGTALAQFKDWYKVGYVAQQASHFNADFPLSVEELVALPLRAGRQASRLSKSERAARVNQALQIVGLTDYRNRRMGALSGGQQQRAFIAKALVSEPQLLILDEPSLGLDQGSVAAIEQVLIKLNREQGLTLLWVSHDIERISALAGRVFCMEAEHFSERPATSRCQQTSVEGEA